MQHHCESCNSSHPACNFHLTHLAWAALWVSNEFGRVLRVIMNLGAGGGHCFAWRVPSFLATHRPTAPPPLLVSEHGDFTLLLCKPCFSVSVCDTHVRRGHQRHTKRDGPLFVILQMSNYCWITQSPQKRRYSRICFSFACFFNCLYATFCSQKITCTRMNQN